MPTVNATVHQALRYFFAGAIAAFLVWFLAVEVTGPWHDRLARVASTLAKPALVGLMFVGGGVVYAIHRVLIYPVIHRLVILSIFGRRGSGLGQWWWQPYGTVMSRDVDLEVSRMAADPHMETRQRERFVGWASEAHMLYTAIEIALLTFLWPGWPIGRPAAARSIAALFALGVLVWAWDRQLVVLERRLLSDQRSSAPTLAAPTQEAS